MSGKPTRAKPQDSRGPASAAHADLDLLQRQGRGIGKLLRLGHRAYCVAMQRELVRHNFTLSEWRHLRTLYDEDGLTPVEISQRIGIERASSTAVLQSLERRRLIRRVRSRKDRRNLHVFLTPAGEALRGTLLPCAVAVNSAARDGLSNDDVFTFFRLIRTMIANLERPAGRRSRLD